MDIDNYSYDFEDRRYLNPETSRDEQMGFIDTLRDMQAQNNEQIQTQTHNLGRDITPDLGGLSGSGGYFQGRYQTPQTNALVSDLKSAAQLSALNQVLSNMQAQAKQRYTKAQQDYQKRQYDKANSPTTTTPFVDPATYGGVDETATGGGHDIGDEDVSITTAPISGLSDTSYVDADGNYITQYSDGTVYKNGVKQVQAQEQEKTDWQPMSWAERAGSGILNQINPIWGLVNTASQLIGERKW